MRNCGDAKAKDLFGVSWGEPAPRRPTTVSPGAIPTASPAHPILTVFGPLRIFRGAFAGGLVVPVVAPLPDVAVHVVQPQCVRGAVLADRVGAPQRGTPFAATVGE